MTIFIIDKTYIYCTMTCIANFNKPKSIKDEHSVENGYNLVKTEFLFCC